MSALHDLARAAGLDPSYASHTGRVATSSDEALLAMLRMLAPQLGFDLHAGIPEAHAQLERARWAVRVPPVVVGWDGAIEVPIRCVADADGNWELEITTESGARHAADGRLFALPTDSHARVDGAIHCIRRARIAVPEVGYHALRWRLGGDGGDGGEALAISAPMRAFGGPGDGAKRWGVFAPVYGLAEPAVSGQAGDLATLRDLFAQVARRGGSYVATLPILAQFLDEPYAYSPYSPASRLAWNELYLDLRALAAEAGPGAVAALPVSIHPPPLVAGAPIDYRAQYAWRRRVIDALAPALLAARGPEIDAWARAAGTYDYAAFRAFGEEARAGWRSWPAAPRDGTPFLHTREAAIAAGADATRLDAHVVAQWAMQRQLAALGGGPVRLYLDLPVGVSCDAYEVWRWREQFLIDASAGAPPDPLFLGGQDWGLPPLSPTALQRDHYRYLIACVRHHMRVAGMLRIDHVMGLFRLYCVPAGRPATDGVYLRYPHDELLAILALESSRARCALVGEDLGVVPEGVRPAMAAHGLFRTHVGQWSLPQRIGAAPEPGPAEAVASLNTHDLATFAGWWRGSDIDDRLDLKLIDRAQDVAQRVVRDQEKQALLAFAGQGGDGALTDVERAMVAATADLARGPAEILLVALDDLSLEPAPHNVPGTTVERPNWQRRIDHWADALAPDGPAPAVAATDAVVAARPRPE